MSLQSRLSGFITRVGDEFQSIRTALNGKANASHNHSGVYEPIITTKNTAFNKDFGSASGTVTQGNDSRLSNTRTPTDSTVTYAKIASGLKSKAAIAASAIDWSSAGVFTKTITGATTFTFSNLELNKVITCVISGDFALTLPTYCKIVSGEYDGTVSNYISMHCTNSGNGTEQVWLTISQEAN